MFSQSITGLQNTVERPKVWNTQMTKETLTDAKINQFKRKFYKQKKEFTQFNFLS